MRILMFGAGVIGTVYGYALSQAGAAENVCRKSAARTCPSLTMSYELILRSISAAGAETRICANCNKSARKNTGKFVEIRSDSQDSRFHPLTRPYFNYFA